MKKLLLSLLAVVAATAVSAQATLKPLNIKQKAATEQKAANVKKMAHIQFTPPHYQGGRRPSFCPCDGAA